MAKILIVEDERSLTNVYREKLSSLGYDVEIAADGDAAVAALKSGIPDIIVLDLIIPKKDGFQVLSEIKANSAWKHIPIIVASNLGEEEDIAKAKKMGVSEYFVKSDVSLADLVNRIKRLLKK